MCNESVAENLETENVTGKFVRDIVGAILQLAISEVSHCLKAKI